MWGDRIFEKVIEESINVITGAEFVGGSSLRGPKLLTIFFEDDLTSVANRMMYQPKLTVEVSSSFPYTDNKMVPLNYNCNYVNESTTTNISGTGGMTRSGRCYTLVMVETVPPKPMKDSLNKKKQKRSLM